VRFSVWAEYLQPWPDILEIARYAESTGWHGVWYADHYMPNTDDVTPGDDPVIECWAVLAALAVAVPRVRLGSLVSPMTVHHPAVLANQAVSVDHISGGRLVLGIGAGWQLNEHHVYGIALPAPGERVARFEEAIQVIQRLLNETRADFDGHWYRLRDAPCEPKPIQRPLPVMVGTGSPRMMRVTARHAQEWNTWGKPEEATRRAALFAQACERVGRDPGTVRRSVQTTIYLVDDPAQLARMRENVDPIRATVGSPAQVVDGLGRYAELGFDELIIPEFHLADTVPEKIEALERIRTEVLAQL
jgi:alkanesulfonate monooxygenase SsuD/methylene tetrahydromethanopterin reductase-like flavin-dependent oxidoreductase (luciferase family)